MLGRLRRHTARPAAAEATHTEATAVSGGGASLVVEAAAAAATASKPLTVDEKAALLPERLIDIVPGLTMPFSRQELGRLKKRFASLLPVDSLAHISVQTLLAMPELAGAPFAKLLATRVVLAETEQHSAFSDDQAKPPRQRKATGVAFDHFVTLLAVLSPKQSVQAKRSVLFQIYDADRDGAVSMDDFVATLASVSSALSRGELHAAVASQFPSWATAQNGETTLSADAFQRLFSDADIHSALTIRF